MHHLPAYTHTHTRASLRSGQHGGAVRLPQAGAIRPAAHPHASCPHPLLKVPHRPSLRKDNLASSKLASLLALSWVAVGFRGAHPCCACLPSRECCKGRPRRPACSRLCSLCPTCLPSWISSPARLPRLQSSMVFYSRAGQLGGEGPNLELPPLDEHVVEVCSPPPAPDAHPRPCNTRLDPTAPPPHFHPKPRIPPRRPVAGAGCLKTAFLFGAMPLVPARVPFSCTAQSVALPVQSTTAPLLLSPLNSILAPIRAVGLPAVRDERRGCRVVPQAATGPVVQVQ